jgi:F-type H+-transporting ATPase subunit a
VYSIRFLGIKGYSLRFVAIGRFREYFYARAHGKKAQKSLLFHGFLDLFVGVLDIFEEITKVFSFSFRLFGNVFAGEVLLFVLAFLVPFVVSVPFMVLELFIGFIQAFIFATLTTAFLGKATTSEAAHNARSNPKHSEG